MAEVTETQLPGVGVRHEFSTGAGERVAVLSHRTGRREIAIYDRADPDSCTTVMHLNPDETRTLADLLGGGPLTRGGGRCATTRRCSARLDPDQHGESASRRHRRSETPGSAPKPDHRSSPSSAATKRFLRPDPRLVLAAEDIVVAVGTPEGLRQLRDLLEA